MRDSHNRKQIDKQRPLTQEYTVDLRQQVVGQLSYNKPMKIYWYPYIPHISNPISTADSSVVGLWGVIK